MRVISSVSSSIAAATSSDSLNASRRMSSTVHSGGKSGIWSMTPAVRTDVLLLDEPTNHLDMDAVDWLGSYLESYRGTVMIISHDRWFIDQCCDRVIEIHDCTCDFYNGNYSYYAVERERRREEQLKHHEHELAEKKRLEATARSMHEHGTEHLAKRAASIEKRIARMKVTDRPKTDKKMTVTFGDPNYETEEVLKVRDITKSYDGREILHDVSFNIRNRERVALLGANGAGKTFTMQLMALRMRRKGIQVFIVAPLKGHEFHRACSNIGGAFIQISPASPNCINVMEIRQTDRSVDEQLDGSTVEHSMLAAKIQRLHIFFSLLIPDMTHEERQLLDEAMIRTYAKKGITHDNDTLRDPKHPEQYREMPILGDLYAVLKESSSTLRLANILNRLVSGSAKTFNQQTNVSLDNKYIVLDISELTGDLLTVGMFMALDFVWDKAKENRTEEKAIFIDECWQLIGASSNRLAAEFVLEIFKIIRGYGGSAVCATQDLNDFFALEDGKYGKGIINNSKTKVILNLEDEEAQRVGSILHLSEAELMEITHFERGSALISTNNNNVAVEIKCSELEKELITTDRRELQELLKRNGRTG